MTLNIDNAYNLTYQCHDLSSSGRYQIMPKAYRPIHINEKTFQKYVKKYGKERAQGYFDAMRDMLNNVEGVFYGYLRASDEYFYQPSPQRVRTRLTEFKEETEFTIAQIEKSEILNNDSMAKGHELQPK
jgi:hypothetical protein